MRPKLFQLVVTAVAVAALVAASTASAAPPATKLEKVSSLVQPAIVYLETKYTGYVRTGNGLWLNDGRPLTVTGSCSGFFVNPDGHFVTAGHCVDKAEGRSLLIKRALTDLGDGYAPSLDALRAALATFKVHSAETPAKAGPDREIKAAYGVDYGGLRAGKPLPARVDGLRPFLKGDVALLKLEVENVPVVELAPSDSTVIGTEIVSVGYPASVNVNTDPTFDPSFKDGTVGSERTIGGGLVKVDEISAALSGGMSGGPTVDVKGRVVGVNSFGIVGEPQPFNFISPVAEVEQLLADEGVENELGAITTTYRAGLAAYYAGDRDEAIARFDGVLGQVSEHEFAQEFRARALRMPEPVEADGGAPIALIAGLLALVALGGAGGAAFVQHRRGRGHGGSPATPPRGPLAPRPSATPVLAITDGPLAGERIAVDSTLTLGRGQVEVELDDREVSRRHAKIEPTAAGLVLTDLESANGTRVNGARIDRPMLLVHGDAIALGRTTLRVETAPVADWRQQATVMRAHEGRGDTAPRVVA